MNILIIGSGGREHAFAWKIAASPRCSELFVAPGNAGTSTMATNLEIAVTDFDTLAEAALQNNVGLILVGPEAPLVNGIVNYFKERDDLKNILIIGPDAAGAALEGSKDFSKEFMGKYGVPTAQSATFTKETLVAGLAYLDEKAVPPYVLKADGLAAGKGVIITSDVAEAKEELRQMLAEAKFGQASNKVLIEQFLTGIELSVFVLTDGKNYKLLPEAKDYKRIGEGDTGLNTGGMGAVSPVPFADAAFLEKVRTQVIRPTLDGLTAEGISYTGFIFIGLMNTDGEPNVIEYNVRMGDPETEVVLPRIETDFLELLIATATGTLNSIGLKISPKTAVTTVTTAGGYPEGYVKGKKILLPELTEGQLLFHAGTRQDGNHIVTNGGRVLACTGMAETVAEATLLSQQLASVIDFERKYYRKDIGKDLIPYLEKS